MSSGSDDEIIEWKGVSQQGSLTTTPVRTTKKKIDDLEEFWSDNERNMNPGSPYLGKPVRPSSAFPTSKIKPFIFKPIRLQDLISSSDEEPKNELKLKNKEQSESDDSEEIPMPEEDPNNKAEQYKSSDNEDAKESDEKKIEEQNEVTFNHAITPVVKKTRAYAKTKAKQPETVVAPDEKAINGKKKQLESEPEAEKVPLRRNTRRQRKESVESSKEKPPKEEKQEKIEKKVSRRNSKKSETEDKTIDETHKPKSSESKVKSTENKQKSTENKSKATESKRKPTENKPKSADSKPKEKTTIKTRSKSADKKSDLPNKEPKPTPKKSSAPKVKEIEDSQEAEKPSQKKKVLPKKYDFNLSSESSDEELIIYPENQVPEEETEDLDLPIALRRSRRIRVKPLKHWKQQRISYEVDENGLFTFKEITQRPPSPKSAKSSQEGKSKGKNKEEEFNPDITPCPYPQRYLTINAEGGEFISPVGYGRRFVHLGGFGLMDISGRQWRLESNADFFLDRNKECTILSRSEEPLRLLEISFK